MPRPKLVYPRQCECGESVPYKQRWQHHKRKCPFHAGLDGAFALAVPPGADASKRETALLRLIGALRSEIADIRREQFGGGVGVGVGVGALTINNSQDNRHVSLHADHTTNNNTNNTTVNVSINMHVHGREDTSHVTQEFKEVCMRMAGEGVTRLIQEVLFNPNKPENMSLRINTLKDYYNGFIEMFGPGGWEITMKNPIYRRVWTRMFREINKIYGEWEIEGDDYVAKKLGSKAAAAAVTKFMSEGEDIVHRRDAKMPRKYLKPIDCMMLKQYKQRQLAVAAEAGRRRGRGAGRALAPASGSSLLQGTG
jgi:hypothetical protein